MATANTVKEILNSKEIYSSTLTKNKKGNFVLRKEFYYTGGNSAELIAEKIIAAFMNAEIVSMQNIWKPFRGGSPVEKSSHFYVEFKFFNVEPIIAS